MNFKNIKYAYFLGIGGIGMSAIARYFNHQGIKVYGYDKTETDLTKELIHEGIEIHFKDLGFRISDLGFDTKETLVIITPAIPRDHEEWKWFRENNFTIMKRSQVLGIISDEYKTIAVAGTHGKTTTSTLIAHILKQSKVDCAAFLGGISTNYNSNLLLHKISPPNKEGAGEVSNTQHQYLVVEADEFDRSFLTLHPFISIITSTDADHLDIYGKHEELKKSFLDFANNLREDGTIFIKKGLDIYNSLVRAYSDTPPRKSIQQYSIKEQADVYAENICIKGDTYYFDLHVGEKILKDLHLGIPGMHNVENAVAACAVAFQTGVTDEELRKALASFRGVKRRFEYQIKSSNMVYIDDYAHHPEELKAIISSVKQMYHDKKITIIFQPHLYSRTRDFVDGFAESLSLADDVLLLDIYPARELPMEGVSSEMIYNKMSIEHKMLCSKKDIIDIISKKKPEVLLTLGAGDIDQLVEPLRRLLVEIKKVA
jgi:UDP-N-acetylmuramate--alanine ligase